MNNSCWCLYRMYDNIPQGALLWLRDYTRGVEERIFEINEEKQVIWY